MRSILFLILSKLLALEAKLIIKKYRPKIVGITGSVGKTGTKEAIFLALETTYRVRRSVNSYNNELGVPLTVIGRESGGRSPLIWLGILFDGFSQIVFDFPYPEWLVVECGVDRPGDIDRLLFWFKPDFVVITALPDIPVHVEFFSSPEAVAEEKLKLAAAVGPGGRIILNDDDPRLLQAKNRFSDEGGNRVITFGFRDKSAVRASSFQYGKFDQQLNRPKVSFQLSAFGERVTIRTENLIARHQVYILLAAAAVSAAAGLPLSKIKGVLTSYLPPPGRMRIFPGLERTLIIDDSYNSSPAAARGALSALASLGDHVPARLSSEGGRKIAIFGDMLELGSFTADAHKALGRDIAAVASVLIAIGPRMRFAVEAIKEEGLPVNVFSFDDWQTATSFTHSFIRPGDLILVKGSQGMRLEKLIENLMAEPAKKRELLCRQGKEWKE